MSPESSRGGSETLSSRFVTFIDGHSFKDTSGYRGAVRGGIYSINLAGQLVPIDRVVFNVFELDADNPGTLGYSIELFDGEASRYGLTWLRGAFYEVDDIVGVEDIALDDLNPDNSVSQLLDSLERAEQAGNLTPNSQT
jgi:hypothetical protein